jgi:hypothetical protein
MNSQIDARLRNALTRLESWPKIGVEVCAELFAARHAASALNTKIAELEAWKQFHEQRNHLTDYGDFRMFKVDDGDDAHFVAAATSGNARRLCVAFFGPDMGCVEVTELPPATAFAVRDFDIDKFVIKTYAEWAAFYAPVSHIISTTAC